MRYFYWLGIPAELIAQHPILNLNQCMIYLRIVLISFKRHWSLWTTTNQCGLNPASANFLIVHKVFIKNGCKISASNIWMFMDMCGLNCLYFRLKCCLVMQHCLSIPLLHWRICYLIINSSINLCYTVRCVCACVISCVASILYIDIVYDHNCIYCCGCQGTYVCICTSNYYVCMYVWHVYHTPYHVCVQVCILNPHECIYC